MRNKRSLRALDLGIAQRRISPLRIELLEERLTLSHAPLAGSQFDQQFGQSPHDNFANSPAMYGQQSFARSGTYDGQSFGMGQGAEMEHAPGMGPDGYFMGERDSMMASEPYRPAMGSGSGSEQFASPPEIVLVEQVTFVTTYVAAMPQSQTSSLSMPNSYGPSFGIGGLNIPLPGLQGSVTSQSRPTSNTAGQVHGSGDVGLDFRAGNPILSPQLRPQSITSDGAGWLVAGATSVAADLSGKAAPAIASTTPSGSPSVSANQMLPADPGRAALGPNVPQIDVPSTIANALPTSPAQPQQQSVPSAPPLVESANGTAVSDMVAVTGPVAGSQSPREPLLAGISADFRAVDAALQDLLSEVETLGEEIAVWFDTIKLSPWTAKAKSGGGYGSRGCRWRILSPPPPTCRGWGAERRRNLQLAVRQSANPTRRGMSQAASDPLLAGLNAGDPRAAADAFVEFEPYLRMVVRRHVAHSVRAKFDSTDIVQSVWADVVDGLRRLNWTFHQRDQLRAFLVKMTRNRLIDRLRQQRGRLGARSRGSSIMRPWPSPLAVPCS